MDRLKSHLIIGFIRLLSRLSLAQAQRCGRWLGRLFWSTGSGMARITRINLRLCMPDLSETERDALARASLEHTACGMMETGIAWMWPEARSGALIVSVHNEALLDRCMRDERGLVIVVPHLGNWEMMNQYYSRRYHGVAIYKPPKLPALDRFILHQREKFGFGIDMFPTTREGVEALFREVGRGQCAFILPDQEPRLKSGVFAPFFGVSALTSKLVPTLQAETGCQVICGSVLRLPDARGFEVRFREMEAGYDDPDPVAAAAAINRTVERCVRETPEQYQWEYKRFKRRPPGESPVY